MTRVIALALLLLVVGSGLVLADEGEPTINRAQLEERLVALQQQELDVIANFNAVRGAIQDVQFWLEQLNAAEAERDMEDIE